MTGSGPGENSPDPGHDDDASQDPTEFGTEDGDVRPTDVREDRSSDASSTDGRPTDRTSPDSSSSERSDVTSRAPSSTDRPSDDADAVTIEDDGYLRWFVRTDDGTVVAVRDILTSVAIVAAIGLLLFGLSGIWPPLVAVESGSMEPNMYRGDLIFVVADDRFVGDDPVAETGVVTKYDAADGDGRFGDTGDVIIFRPAGGEGTPVIHRAHFWVESGENWVETQANPEYVDGDSCDDLEYCPAPHDGFVTKGDANPGYDQAGYGAQTTVVSPDWITGKGLFRIPWLGYVRLTFDALFFAGPGASVLTTAGLSAGTVGAVAVGYGRSR